jgi:hypothetical protein
MAVSAPPRRQPLAGRRTGYVIAVAVNAAVLFLINVWPGWDAVPFLTGDTEQVLGLVNVSLAVSVAANLAYLVHDPPWFRALGEALTAAIGFVVLVRLWQVFPFDVGSAWATVLRVLLALAALGTAIGVIVQSVAALRVLSGTSGPDRRR